VRPELELKQRTLRQSLQTQRHNLLASAWAARFAGRAEGFDCEDVDPDEDPAFREQLAELQHYWRETHRNIPMPPVNVWLRQILGAWQSTLALLSCSARLAWSRALSLIDAMLSNIKRDIPYFVLMMIAVCLRHGQRHEPADSLSPLRPEQLSVGMLGPIT
jgi:hypothetical protein